MKIGPYTFKHGLILAPMAGVTDKPFRTLCRHHGAELAVSEMTSSNPKLWSTKKSQKRLDHFGEDGIRSVQIVGGDPEMMATAARFNVKQGAQIIDINMGCPAKKVCKKAAGSALLKDPDLVKAILEAVVDAVDVPVTLKIRTGWAPEMRNGPQIADIAQNSGIAALAVHGRTRECKYSDTVEYDTIKAIKKCVTIPVIANGNINSPEKAKQVLAYTDVDGIMIGRTAQGKPWVFKEIQTYLETGKQLEPPSADSIKAIMLGHIQQLHDFYGNDMGLRIARKHVGWYLASMQDDRGFRKRFNCINVPAEQLRSVEQFFETSK